MYEVRKARKEEIDQIVQIIQEGRLYFQQAGIPQWQNAYPDRTDVEKDIDLGQSYVLVHDQMVIATACIILGHDPNYDVIEGTWLNDEPYAVIHRIAINQKEKGKHLAGHLMTFATQLAQKQGVRNIRIDTHELNRSMRRFVEKEGFVECGVVYMEDHSPRIAYQKILLEDIK